METAPESLIGFYRKRFSSFRTRSRRLQRKAGKVPGSDITQMMWRSSHHATWQSKSRDAA